MVSTMAMKVLVAIYLGISVASLFEGNNPRALYWLSAALLTVSILWGTR